MAENGSILLAIDKHMTSNNSMALDELHDHNASVLVHSQLGICKLTDQNNTKKNLLHANSKSTISTYLEHLSSQMPRLYNARYDLDIDIKPVLEDLFEALFNEPRLGVRPQLTTLPVANSKAIVNFIDGELTKVNRTVYGNGQHTSDQIHPLKQLTAICELDIDFEFSVQSISKINQNDLSLLNELDAKLTPHGLTVMAIHPTEKSRVLTVISTLSVVAIKSALTILGIHYMLASRYFEKM